MGVDFDSDLGKLQRLMAESIAGTTRRNAILNEMQIQAGDTIESLIIRVQHVEGHAVIESLIFIENKSYA